jgi:hypothetical protein
MTNIHKYLEKNQLQLEDVAVGMFAFGRVAMDCVCEEALNEDKLIEFYIASEDELVMDKLSYRLISREEKPGKN